MYDDLNRRLLDFIADSPSSFHAAARSAALLEQAGFRRLEETEPWTLGPGDRAYTVRNGSSIVAFRVGTQPGCYAITASHSDSPCFQLKEQPVRSGPGSYTRLSCEKYGGSIYSTWFDRPLTVAGRLIVKAPGGLRQQLCHVDAPTLLLPNVAIHMNREVNRGYAYHEQVDLLPLYAAGDGADFWGQVAESAGVAPEDIVSHELFVVPYGRGYLWGNGNEFISAPRLDDLQCAFATLEGFLQGGNARAISVWCCFDNEEVGSRTKQGAASTLLRDTLTRISAALGWDEPRHLQALAGSLLLSADNAHAVHPNHPEYSDPDNQVTLGGGVVIKRSASQSYATDAVASAIVQTLCRTHGIGVQSFANRSDLPGGSTLGNIASAQVSVRMADIGLAQLAMHSCFETAACRDTEAMARLAAAFYQTGFSCTQDAYSME